MSRRKTIRGALIVNIDEPIKAIRLLSDDPSEERLDSRRSLTGGLRR